MKRTVAAALTAVLIAAACGAPAAQPTPTPDPSPTPTPEPLGLVYLARDQLPPVAVRVAGAGVGATSVERIRSRLEALPRATAQEPLFNPAAQMRATLASVEVEGIEVTVDYTPAVDDWGVGGSATVIGLVQQLVYTATEEPGIRRVTITQNGGQPAVIGGEGLIVDRSVERENIFGYLERGSLDTIEMDDGVEVPTEVARWEATVDEVQPGLARFVVELAPTGPAPEGPWFPRFSVSVAHLADQESADDGKYMLLLDVLDATLRVEGERPTGELGVFKTPLRYVAGETYEDGTRFRIHLDDLRPWRIFVLHEPTRVVVDIGGHPRAIGGDTVVYEPLPGATVGHTFTVSGAARAFEANVLWRVYVEDPAGERELARGFTTATLGTSAVWGSYSTGITVPADFSGDAILQVFQESARDGEVIHLVEIPITVR